MVEEILERGHYLAMSYEEEIGRVNRHLKLHSKIEYGQGAYVEAGVFLPEEWRNAHRDEARSALQNEDPHEFDLDFYASGAEQVFREIEDLDDASLAGSEKREVSGLRNRLVAAAESHRDVLVRYFGLREEVETLYIQDPVEELVQDSIMLELEKENVEDEVGDLNSFFSEYHPDVELEGLDPFVEMVRQNETEEGYEDLLGALPTDLIE